MADELAWVAGIEADCKRAVADHVDCDCTECLDGRSAIRLCRAVRVLYEAGETDEQNHRGCSIAPLAVLKAMSEVRAMGE